MEFKVKRSFLSIFIANLILVFLVCVSFYFSYNTWVFIVTLAIAICLLCLYDTSVIFTSCKVENNTITYKAGIFKYVIDINSIEKAEKNTSYGPSLANSPIRVRIVAKENGKHKFYYISIEDRDKFIELITNNKAESKKETSEKKEAVASKKEVAVKKSTKKTTTTAKKTVKKQ